MPTYIKSVTFDCRDALVVARFWAAALGGELDEDSTADKAYVEAPGWGAPNLWFQRVPEPRTAKLRMHFDLRAPGGVPEEVERLASLGATVKETNGDLTVMQDPEGNEFCVEN
ncbi:VOC family protein [Actinoplanes sp. NPDC051513]|uniref:VOC family protein n=1 Tax=Actinoplanes sp. NPDC051513 TaxID=3363908 RepID=UPI0037ABB8FE